MMRLRWCLIGAVMAMFAFGCKSGGTVADVSTLELDPNPVDDTVTVEAATVVVGGYRDYTYVITNTGRNRDLTIGNISMTLDYTPTDAEVADPEGKAFQLISLPAFPVIVAPRGTGDAGRLEYTAFTVRFRRFDDSVQRSAKVLIENDNTGDKTRRNLVITFQTGQSAATLDVPARVDFGTVGAAQTPSRDIPLQNIGSSNLYVDWFQFQGDAHFTLEVGGQFYTGDQSQGQFPIDPPLEIAPGTGVVWKVRFAPDSAAPAQARLLVHPSNDPMAPNGREVIILANDSGPRICVEPGEIDFGAKEVGVSVQTGVRITSCGTTVLTVTGIALKDASADYSLLFDELEGAVAPTADSPLSISKDAFEMFGIQFTPDVVNPTDPDSGKVIPDTATIVITSNSFETEVEVPVKGFGVEAVCPRPTITIDEGEEVIPQTVLHLHGEQSQGASGEIISYSWTVTQPADNKFNLDPVATYPSPTHQVNVAGEYEYCLDVCDAVHCSNDATCNTTVCKIVRVVPTESIHVELTWDTPADSNQFDEGDFLGSDLDLHFLHTFAAGDDLNSDGKLDGWFDMKWDCFWMNKNPAWEGTGDDDDPSLDRDDMDGAGPENINLDLPVNGRFYRIGVDYWDDHGFGPSYPRIKIYIYGVLVYDRNLKSEGKQLTECQMWEPARIIWGPSPKVESADVDGKLNIIKGALYKHCEHTTASDWGSYWGY